MCSSDLTKDRDLQKSGELFQCRHQLIIREGEAVMHGIEELEEHAHHLFLEVGGSQDEESIIFLSERRVFKYP